MNTENKATGHHVSVLLQAGVVAGDVHLHEHPATRTAPHNLPPVTPRFTGRDRESAELTRLAGAERGSRVCVVDGAPGIGKTTFAVHWADSARALFPDGQIYVDLRGFDPQRPPVAPEAAIRVLLDSLHVPPAAVPPHPDGQLALFRNLVDHRRLLLVLDNAHDSEQVRPLLPRSAGSFTVVTSRHRLDGLHLHNGADRLTLLPLTDQEAVLLVERHLGPRQVDAEREAVRRVVTACEGHPLALSVVAARVALDPGVSLAAVVDELADRNAALDALTLPDGADLRAVFALSYNYLPEPAAAAFRYMALNPGTSFDAAAVAAMTGTELREARRTLAELDRRHLVSRRSAGRYAFHHLTLAFAEEKARTDLPERHSSAVPALLNHHLHAANRADRLINAHRRPVDLEPCARPDLLPDLTDRDAAMEWYAVEYDNVLAAAKTAAARAIHPYTWQLPWVLSNFAYLTARWRDWADTHVDAVAAARHLGNRPVEARLLQTLARAHSEAGEHAESVKHYQAALDILDDLDDVPGEANALNGLSGALLRSGAHDEAWKRAVHALDLYTSLNDRAGQASTHGLLGRVSHAAGRTAEAVRYHRLAQRWYDEIGDIYGLAHTADCLAELELASGKPGPAADLLRKAAELHHRVGNLHYAIQSCRTLRALMLTVADIAPSTGGLDRAITTLENRSPLTTAELAALITPTVG
ncbi:tetratricopeptide repeat protein [Saccharothrix variisporea]|uniref:Putative ATPase n=1 Tax=Saccharothrix variisporea TaxID=543527 RepID=A0A495XIP0_9PSEU|nr:tetratricopeptide repeat protein [Saccharothrix variisporea]RKT74361.1 putative ATPase [Saccharothrix variisporea]